MLQTKQTKQALPPRVVRVIAEAGKIQPVLYKGSIIFIGSDKAVEIDENALDYQAKAQLAHAMKIGDIKLADAKIADAEVEGN